MWLTLAKGLLFKGVGLLKSPLTWIVLLALSTALCARGWQGARADLAQERQRCVAAASVALQRSLQEQAEAWQSVFGAYNEALVRLSLSEAQQAAQARHWKQRFAEAKRINPACAAWSEAVIGCPLD